MRHLALDHAHGVHEAQAIRIELNRELDVLEDSIDTMIERLAPGGRLSIITFHSLEDRIVKNIMKTGNAEGKTDKDFFGNVNSPLTLVNNKIITPGDDEL